MYTFFQVLINAFGQRFNFESGLLEETDALVKLFLGTAEFQNNHAFPARKDPGLQNIENKVVLLNQVINNRLIHNVGGISNYDLP